jgi:hypothetical protein
MRHGLIDENKTRQIAVRDNNQKQWNALSGITGEISLLKRGFFCSRVV